MIRSCSYSLVLILIALCVFKLVQGSSHSVEHVNDQGTADKASLYPVRPYGILSSLNLVDSDDDYRKMLDYSTKYSSFKKPRTELTDISDDLDEILQSMERNELESIPPILVALLANRRKEKSSRILTPRLGRDVDDDIDCQRSRPPFAPRLGKKSLPFKPRLGRAYDDTKC